jgi:hypothetical protein
MTKKKLLASTAPLLRDRSCEPKDDHPTEQEQDDDDTEREAPELHDQGTHIRQKRPRIQRGQTEDDDAPDELVPDPTVAREFNVSLVTIWRWTHDPALGFPPPIKATGRPTGRNYRSRKAVEHFKKRAIERAIRDRSQHGRAEGARR